MRLRTKLMIGFTIIIVSITIFAVFAFTKLSLLHDSLHDVVGSKYDQVQLVHSIRYEINSLSRELGHVLLAGDHKPKQESLDQIRQNRDQVIQTWQKLKYNYENPSNLPMLKRIENEYAIYISSYDKSLGLALQGNAKEALEVYQANNEPARIALFQAIREFKAHVDSQMGVATTLASQTYVTAVITVVLLIATSVAVTAASGWWLYRNISASLRRVTTVMNQMSYGDIETMPRLQIKTHDEVSSISDAFNRMADRLKEHNRQEQEYLEALQEQNWRKTAVADITFQYQGVQDLHMLTNTFLSKALPKLGITYGVFYIRVDRNGYSPHLVKVSSYASGNPALLRESFEFGEGLVGQCAKESRMITLQDPPADYIRISSGLGSSVPATVILMPVVFEQSVVGVVELASLHPISSSHRSLLEELLYPLGVAINRISSQMKVQELLRESQVFTEELQAQSEELQQQQEELRALNERLEEQVKQSNRKSQELERSKLEIEHKTIEIVQASKYKSEFLANVSHELRTPLNSLLILSQMLSENREGNLSVKQLEFARTIHSSGSELLTMINEILDLSKIESGRTELTCEPVVLHELLEETRRQFAPIAEQKRIQFTVEADQHTADLTMITDIYKLRSIVKNLLSNAMKFTDQGYVRVSVRNANWQEIELHPVLSHMGGALAFVVEDSGIGIAKDKLEVIFQAFRQADGTTSRRFGGTGLGLSIAKELVAMLGGFIKVESQEGRGSVFTLFVPADSSDWVNRFMESEAAAAAETKDIEDERVWSADMEASATAFVAQYELLKGKRVLLVDDDMRNIYALTTLLESYGIQVSFAENGEEGLEMLQKHPETDLVLMDIMMPKMDGYEAIGQIRSRKEYQSLPIIALTAKAMKHDKEACIQAGASDYISKPLQVDQLLSVLQVWLHK